MCRGALPALDAGRREEQVAPAHMTGALRGPGRTQEAVWPLICPCCCMLLASPYRILYYQQTAVSEACEQSPPASNADRVSRTDWGHLINL